MIKNKQYIRLQEVLSRVLRHPLMQDVDIEAAIQYAIDFIHIVGVPEMFEDKETIIEIKKFKGKLPCDLISINQVMDMATQTCLRSMTDTFMTTGHDNGLHTLGHRNCANEMTFKTQNSCIITSFEEGTVKVSYKSIPVDDNGFPLLIDNPTYLKALELYIKKEVFTILYDQGKIQAGVMQNTQQDYAWKVGQLQSEMTIPSESEMESLCRSWCTLVQRTTDFDNGWRNLGNREYNRIQ